MKLFLSFCLIFLPLWVWAEETRTYEAAFYGYPTGIPHQPIPIDEKTVIGQVFSAPLTWHSLRVSCPSYGNAIGGLTLKLYPWKEDYATTRQQPVLAEKRFDDFADNAVLKLEIPPQPAGKYLLTLERGTEKVGVWYYLKTSSGSELFRNGERMEGTLKFTIGSLGSPFPFQGTVERYRTLLSKSTSPPPAPMENSRDVFADTWDAMDSLDRPVVTHEKTGRPRSEKKVGIFYWTWHDKDGNVYQYEPHNNEEKLATHPEADGDPKHPVWGSFYLRHHWGEPLLGFYTTMDTWVLRKHAQMLAVAGVDVVVFDCTNRTWTWMDSTWKLLETFRQAREEGVVTPQVAFMLPFGNLEWTQESLRQLYRDIYRDGKYRDLWFYWDGKPLIYALPEAAENAKEKAETEAEKEEWEAIRCFFAFRPGQPQHRCGPERPDHWSWLEVYPQNGYGHRSDGTFDMMSVGVAQNHSLRKRDGSSGLAAMNDQNVFGRGYRVGKDGKDENPRTTPDRFLYGDNFAQQWEHALKIDPDFVFITGWNEWIAGRFPKWMGTESAFPDQYSPEFSRDIEPSAGILRDHFYLQMVSYIRQFKGCRPQKSATENPVYRDFVGDTRWRDAKGYGKTHYVNETGRNDLAECFVRHDAENLYFAVECTDTLTPPSDPHWMRLFLNVSDDLSQPHWERF
ncbi:MAG: hypothetical protein Q4E67_06975, partial [Planctomycetia bacterium]|nr:hypothetical protein [Planctomycetia bacterium]